MGIREARTIVKMSRTMARLSALTDCEVIWGNSAVVMSDREDVLGRGSEVSSDCVESKVDGAPAAKDAMTQGPPGEGAIGFAASWTNRNIAFWKKCNKGSGSLGAWESAPWCPRLNMTGWRIRC